MARRTSSVTAGLRLVRAVERPGRRLIGPVALLVVSDAGDESGLLTTLPAERQIEKARSHGEDGEPVTVDPQEQRAGNPRAGRGPSRSEQGRPKLAVFTGRQPEMGKYDRHSVDPHRRDTR